MVPLTLRFQLPQSDGQIAITTQTTVSRIHPIPPPPLSVLPLEHPQQRLSHSDQQKL